MLYRILVKQLNLKVINNQSNYIVVRVQVMTTAQRTEVRTMQEIGLLLHHESKTPASLVIFSDNFGKR